MTNRLVRGVSLTPAEIRANFPDLADASVNQAIRSVTATATLDADDGAVLADATGGAITINLPTAASAYSEGAGRSYTVKRLNSGGNAVTLDGASSETIDGATTKALSAQYAACTVQSNGTAWFITNLYVPA